jgi:hypothetical protein
MAWHRANQNGKYGEAELARHVHDVPQPDRKRGS